MDASLSQLHVTSKLTGEGQRTHGVNNGFDHGAAAGKHENCPRVWYWTNEESSNLISGEPELLFACHDEIENT